MKGDLMTNSGLCHMVGAVHQNTNHKLDFSHNICAADNGKLIHRKHNIKEVRTPTEMSGPVRDDEASIMRRAIM